ncbi:Rho GTPase activating protein [Malassezia sp. CBS 17886]|nr:Rho GTPase activating protein [Malassezia sp. CBS 17886]
MSSTERPKAERQGAGQDDAPDARTRQPPSPPPRRAPSPEGRTGAPATLYAASPYVAADERRRARENRRAAYGERHPLFFGSARRIQNPSMLTLVVIALGLLCIFVRWPIGRVARGPIACVAPPAPSVSIPPRSMPAQKTFTLASRSKGCHLVQAEVEGELRDQLRGVKVRTAGNSADVQAGILTLFIQHTSAALSLNENFDRDVRTDMDMALDNAVPESLPWKHTDEGPDDSASHTKASLIGPSLTVPITDGRLNLGTWQGIYLCEFRRMKHARRIVATVLP